MKKTETEVLGENVYLLKRVPVRDFKGSLKHGNCKSDLDKNFIGDKVRYHMHYAERHQIALFVSLVLRIIFPTSIFSKEHAISSKNFK